MNTSKNVSQEEHDAELDIREWMKFWAHKVGIRSIALIIPSHNGQLRVIRGKKRRNPTKKESRYIAAAQGQVILIQWWRRGPADVATFPNVKKLATFCAGQSTAALKELCI